MNQFIKSLMNYTHTCLVALLLLFCCIHPIHVIIAILDAELEFFKIFTMVAFQFNNNSTLDIE